MFGYRDTLAIQGGKPMPQSVRIWQALIGSTGEEATQEGMAQTMRTASAIALVFMAGCAGPTHWVHQTKCRSEWMADAEDCRAKSVGLDSGSARLAALNACLVDKGWEQKVMIPFEQFTKDHKYCEPPPPPWRGR
jgi:hypothetical protein